MYSICPASFLNPCRILSINLYPTRSSTPQSTTQVSVDSLPVYTSTTAESSVVTTLTKGNEVIVRLRVANSEGSWCKVSQEGRGEDLGFVRCSGLSGNIQPQARNSSGTNASPRQDLSVNPIAPCVDSPIPAKLQGGGRIYVVPIGTFSSIAIDYLRDCYARRFALDIRALPRIPIDPNALDTGGLQLIAEPLIAEMRQKYSRLAATPGVVLIGFTVIDMYGVGERPGWQWEFGHRQDNRFGVISMAHFVVPYDDEPVTGSVLLSRLRKAFGRYLGFLYYRLPPNKDPKSLMYSEMAGIDDLDAISEDF